MGSNDHNNDNSPIECGVEAAKRFAFAPGYRNLNHGSYGTYPLEVRSVYRHYQEESEARPDNFVRFQYRPKLLRESRQAIADYLDVPIDCCVFSPNTSTAIDTILRNIVFEEGDVAVCFADVYPSFLSTLRYLSTRSPLVVSTIPCAQPQSHDWMCSAFEKEIERLRREGKNPKVAIFDTISSLPGVRLPFERLVQLCKAHNIFSLVDGAHGVGHLPLQLRSLDPDFFVSNLHKWLYTPRGCAVLYVPGRNQHLLKATLPTAFGYGGSFVNNFGDLGTLNNSAYLCTQAAIAWRRRLRYGSKIGEEAIFDYCMNLAREGGKAVAKMLGTEVMGNEEGTLGMCNLVNVRMPLVVEEVTGGNKEIVGKVELWMMERMISEYETAVYFFPYAGSWWVRLSAQVYLTIEDFKHAGRKLVETSERVKKGEWKSTV